MHERFAYKDKSELLKKAAELGLTLPFSDDISPLFRPLAIDKFNIGNRLVVQPMEGYDSEPDGTPSSLTERRYLRYASGGSSIIWYEAVAVTRDGRSNPAQLWITRGNADQYKRLNSEVREKAALTGHNPMLVVQLTHSGRYSKPDGAPGPLAGMANAILDKVEPHILTDEELDRIQDGYVVAAKLCAYAGFDAVDLKACHGYLMIDLLASAGRIDSIYGGKEAARRFRFFLDTIDRIRNEVPGIFVTTRLNMSDVYAKGFGVTDGEKPDYSEALQLTAELSNRGISMVNLSMGSPYHNPHVTRPYDTPVPGAIKPDEHPLSGVVRMIEATALFQKQFPGMHFIGSAYSWLRQYAPNVGAAVIESGMASLIGLGRSSFAYPDMPEDLRRNGSADPSKVCITCSGCTRLIRNLRRGGCVIRDREIYGPELKKLIADGK